MSRAQSFIAHGVATCLLLASIAQPAVAGGLIATERVAATLPDSRSAVTIAQDAAAAQRAALSAALVRGGVAQRQADARLAALTDVEVAELTDRYASAPAGGMWFAPFLLVAMVIGALIRKGESERAGGQADIDTDLFGRPRNIAAAP
jgi:hypothetical protein